MSLFEFRKIIEESVPWWSPYALACVVGFIFLIVALATRGRK